jgi:hypothetical protein
MNSWGTVLTSSLDRPIGLALIGNCVRDAVTGGDICFLFKFPFLFRNKDKGLMRDSLTQAQESWAKLAL